LNSRSVTVRLGVSLLSNGTRAALSFFAGLLLARALKPAAYGDMTFLLGSFVGMRTMLDMGASNAFYTFISGLKRSRKYFLVYLVWIALQFVGTSSAILFLMPDRMVGGVWLGHSRGIILLAFFAAFMQQQVWLTIAQIGESSRKTVRVQAMNLGIALVHLGLVLILMHIRVLSAPTVFVAMIAEYLVAIGCACVLLRSRQTATIGEDPVEVTYVKIIGEFFVYCRPLVLLSIVGFAYDFADRWMLQRFSGSAQQGLYQAAYQIAAISLLAATSVMRVFWKEISEAHALGNLTRIAYLYQRVNRGLLMFAAIVSAFVIPWTREIIKILLGANYLPGASVLIIMFLFPVHQTMGQVGGTMLLASGNTRWYTTVSTLAMLLSLPVSYAVQAPRSAMVPGLGMGAIGLALKMVIIGVVSVNVQAFIIARIFTWKFDWFFQVVGIGSVIALSVVAKCVGSLFWHPVSTGIVATLTPIGISACIYSCLIATLLWFQPWLVGMDRGEVGRISRHLLNTVAGRIDRESEPAVSRYQ